jgi:hypothetical protein
MVLAQGDIFVQEEVIDEEYFKFISSPTTIGHVLASIPPDYVQKALTATKKHGKRQRILP